MEKGEEKKMQEKIVMKRGKERINWSKKEEKRKERRELLIHHSKNKQETGFCLKGIKSEILL